MSSAPLERLVVPTRTIVIGPESAAARRQVRARGGHATPLATTAMFTRESNLPIRSAQDGLSTITRSAETSAQRTSRRRNDVNS